MYVAVCWEREGRDDVQEPMMVEELCVVGFQTAMEVGKTS